MLKPSHNSHKRHADYDKDRQKRKEDEIKRHKESHLRVQANPVDNRLRRETPFICNVRFKNDLPEVPCDPKMLVAPLQPEKLAEFSITTLETESKKDLVLQPDLGIPISLLDSHRYQVPDNGTQLLDPADEELLAPLDNVALKARVSKSKSKEDDTYKPWLLKTTYIADLTHGSRTVKQPRRPSQAAQTSPEELRVQHVKAIEESFAAAQRTPVHATNPDLKPVEVHHVLPDFDFWKIGYAYGNFENDPAEDIPEALQHIPESQRRTALDRSLFVKFTEGQQDDGKASKVSIALCIPKEISDPADATDTSQLEGDYSWTKEFVWSDFTDVAGQYLIYYGPEGVTYCPVLKRTTFRKPVRKALAKGEAPPPPAPRPAKVVVSARAPNEREQARYQQRMQMLEEEEFAEGDELGEI